LSDSLIRPSFLLFLDGLIISIGGWIFWLIVARFTTVTEIGYATAIISLVTLSTALITLGMEYPILRCKESLRPKAFGSLLFFEIVLSLSILPLIYFIGDGFYSSALTILIPFALIIFVTNGISFISKHALIGSIHIRSILLIDIIATVIKFIVLTLLIFGQFEALEIILALIGQQITLAVLFTLAALKKIKFQIANKKLFKEFFRQSIVNFPSKLSKFLVVTLIIVLLSALGADPSDVGRFYIILMIFMAVASLPTSLFLIAIPISESQKQDLSVNSYRVGISITTPLIALMVTIPTHILYFLGSSYVEASNLLIIVGFALIPYLAVINSVTHLNNKNRSKELVILGIIELSAFFISFFSLFPSFGIMGAAISVLIAFSASALYSMKIGGKKIVLPTVYSLIAVFVAWLLAYTLEQMTAISWLGAIGIPISFAIILLSKCFTFREFIDILRNIRYAR